MRVPAECGSSGLVMGRACSLPSGRRQFRVDPDSEIRLKPASRGISPCPALAFGGPARAPVTPRDRRDQLRRRRRRAVVLQALGRDRRADPFRDRPDHDDDPFAPGDPHPHLIPRLDLHRRLRGRPVHPDMTGTARRRGLRTRLEQPHRPHPAVEAGTRRIGVRGRHVAQATEAPVGRNRPSWWEPAAPAPGRHPPCKKPVSSLAESPVPGKRPAGRDGPLSRGSHGHSVNSSQEP